MANGEVKSKGNKRIWCAFIIKSHDLVKRSVGYACKVWCELYFGKPNAFLNLETRPHFVRFVDADSSKVWLFLGEACLFLHTLILTNSMHDCSNLTKTIPDLSQLLDTMLIIDLGEAYVGPSFISVSVLQFLFLEYIHKSCHDCGESSLFLFLEVFLYI